MDAKQACDKLNGFNFQNRYLVGTSDHMLPYIPMISSSFVLTNAQSSTISQKRWQNQKKIWQNDKRTWRSLKSSTALTKLGILVQGISGFHLNWYLVRESAPNDASNPPQNIWMLQRGVRCSKQGSDMSKIIAECKSNTLQNKKIYPSSFMSSITMAICLM